MAESVALVIEVRSDLSEQLIYALCMVISRLSSDLSTTRPDLGAYVR